MNREFGKYGGQFIEEERLKMIKEVEAKYNEAKEDKEYQEEVKRYQKNYAGRPTMLYEAERLTAYYGRGKILLKREDMLYTGTHKINNVIGQMLLARRMNKQEVVTESKTGRNGLATATISRLMGIKCKIYMDVNSEERIINRIEKLGGEVIKTEEPFKDSLKYYAEDKEERYYLMSTAIGPRPYPMMVRDFQRCIGRELRAQCIKEYGKLPTAVIASVGGGSNAIGTFYEFIEDKGVRLIGIEGGGKNNYDNAKRLSGRGRLGIVNGAYTYVLQSPEGQIIKPYSIARGLRYYDVNPELVELKELKRAEYESVTDEEAEVGYKRILETEGIMVTMETAHAIGYLEKIMPMTKENDMIVVTITGREEE